MGTQPLKRRSESGARRRGAECRGLRAGAASPVPCLVPLYDFDAGQARRRMREQMPQGLRGNKPRPARRLERMLCFRACLAAMVCIPKPHPTVNTSTEKLVLSDASSASPAASAGVAAARLTACRDCDLLQEEVALERHADAHCVRCGARLYRGTRTGLTTMLSLMVGCAVLMVVANLFPIALIEVQGAWSQTTLVGHRAGLVPERPAAGCRHGRRDHDRAAGAGSRADAVPADPAALQARAAGFAARVSPGPAGASVEHDGNLPARRAGDPGSSWATLATVMPGVSLWAFCGLIVLFYDGRIELQRARLLALGRFSRRRRRGRLMASAASRGLASCHSCGLLCRMHARHEALACPRCSARLHLRKPRSILRTWALLVVAAILYIPANYLPIWRATAAGEPVQHHPGRRHPVLEDRFLVRRRPDLLRQHRGAADETVRAGAAADLVAAASSWDAASADAAVPDGRVHRPLVDARYLRGRPTVALVQLGPLVSMQPGPGRWPSPRWWC